VLNRDTQAAMDACGTIRISSAMRISTAESWSIS